MFAYTFLRVAGLSSVPGYLSMCQSLLAHDSALAAVAGGVLGR